jgi:short-chain 2-methylacyl-CoA dehydrogenase
MATDTSYEQSKKVAEAGREAEWKLPSFGKELFNGRLDLDLIHPQPPLDPADVDRGEAFLADLRAFLLEHVDPLQIEHDARIPDDVLEGLKEIGAFGMKIPADYGGLGLTQVYYNRALAIAGTWHSSLATVLSAHQSIGLPQPLRMFGSEEQKREWLPDLAAGKKLAAFGLTEPGAGSDAGASRTQAELADGEWVVNGSKIFITNAGTDITACVTITAVTGEGEISNLIVPNGTAGYEISAPMDKLGWRASDTRELSFKDARVPEGNLLGPRGEGFRQFLEILDGGRISVAAMGVGLAQGAYDLAFRYAQEREQFGKPIASFQAIQFQLADMAVEIEAGRNLVYKAAWLKDEGRDFAKEAAMAKLYTGELSHRVVNQALQIHGGYGFIEESAIARLYRDQKILEIGEGTNEVQRMVIARHLGL